jgi:hypothetical protein
MFGAWLAGISVVMSKRALLSGAAQIFGAILEHPQSATGAVVDPGVSF